MITYRNLGNCGRLGNQLFQVAATIGVANSRYEPAVLPADWNYRPYFSIPDEFYGDTTKATDVVELIDYMDPRAAPYLQDWSLFAHCEDEIRQLFLPSARALHETLACEPFWQLRDPVLSVHVRRGDNVPGQDPATPDKQLYHPLPTLDYYKRAIAACDNQYRSIAVFGDDPEWNEANLDGDYFHHGQPRPKENEPGYEDPATDWIDLFLMAACDCHVLSNSTYGWWGAYLANDPHPITITPWFGPNVAAYTDENLMFPPGWRKLPREC